MTKRQQFPSWGMRGVAAACIAAAFLLFPVGAKAELKLCNTTSSKIGVAIGYKDKDGWTSEGWWNVDSQTCALLIQDKLRARFYYVYAFDYDKGGEWGGPIPMCTKDDEFIIRGIESCDGRGFKKSGFFEVDTQEQSDWTVRLTDQGAAQAAAPPQDGQNAQSASGPTDSGTRRR